MVLRRRRIHSESHFITNAYLSAGRSCRDSFLSSGTIVDRDTCICHGSFPDDSSGNGISSGSSHCRCVYIISNLTFTQRSHNAAGNRTAGNHSTIVRATDVQTLEFFRRSAYTTCHDTFHFSHVIRAYEGCFISITKAYDTAGILFATGADGTSINANIYIDNVGTGRTEDTAYTGVSSGYRTVVGASPDHHSARIRKSYQTTGDLISDYIGHVVTILHSETRPEYTANYTACHRGRLHRRSPIIANHHIV